MQDLAVYQKNLRSIVVKESRWAFGIHLAIYTASLAGFLFWCLVVSKEGEFPILLFAVWTIGLAVHGLLDVVWIEGTIDKWEREAADSQGGSI